MFELVKTGGWLMWPIILCSVIALAIIGERLWTLQRKYISPATLVEQIQQWLKRKELDQARIQLLAETSPLGRILASGLANRDQSREIVKEAIEDTGRHVATELERYLTTLGTVAAITPFLGLLGTVLGMIEMFSGISTRGVGDPTIVAGGIGQALITTAAGIGVAIPSVIAYRYFRGQVSNLLIEMEQEAIKLVEILHGKNDQV